MKSWIDQRIGRQFLFVFYLFIGLTLLTSLAVYVYTENQIEQTTWFEQNAVTEKEKTYASDARTLFVEYQERVMPSLERYVAGKQDGSVTEPFLKMPTLGKVNPQKEPPADCKFKINSKSAADMSASIVDMESVFTEYRNSLNAEEDALRAQLATHTKWAQALWLLSLLGVLFILFIVARPYVRRLTRQLQELIENSKRLAGERQPMTSAAAQSKNEVGQLTTSFRQMATSMSSTPQAKKWRTKRCSSYSINRLRSEMKSIYIV